MQRIEKQNRTFWGPIPVHILFILLLFSSGFFSSIPLLAQALKVTDSEVSRLESVLKKNSILQNESQSKSLEDLFRARSAAHRLRLSQVYLQMTKDPQFIKEFPEFAPLVSKSKKTVLALLEHDASKVSTETAKAIHALSLTQGINYRNPPPNLSARDQKLIVTTMKNAIDDLNTMDDKFMAEAFKKISPNAVWTQAHESLTETIDFYDTFKSRQAELAKDGKPLLSPSLWFEKLEAEGYYSEEEKKSNALKKRFARFLEKKDPLKEPAAQFAKAEDFTHLSTNVNLTKEIDQSFLSKSKILIKQASHVQTLQTMNRLLSFGKALPGSYLLMYGVSYAVSPETTKAEDVFANFVMSSETSNCDTMNCQHFFAECAKKLKIKLTSHHKIMAKKEFPQCLTDFFNLSLNEQAEQRKDDNLDAILTAYAPSVRNITCSADGLIAQIEVTDEGNKIFHHKMVFSPTSSPAQILRDEDIPPVHDRLIFKDSKAQLFQHCTKNNTNCKNYDIKDMLEIKLGFWRDDRIPRIFSGAMKQVPIDSFKWARKSYQLAENQSTAIKNCCKESSCQQFFTKRKITYDQAIKRQLIVNAEK